MDISPPKLIKQVGSMPQGLMQNKSKDSQVSSSVNAQANLSFEDNMDINRVSLDPNGKPKKSKKLTLDELGKAVFRYRRMLDQLDNRYSQIDEKTRDVYKRMMILYQRQNGQQSQMRKLGLMK